MSTIQEIISSEFITGVSLPKINANFEALNTDKLEAADIAGKQNTLVSGTNIKTINSVSVLGSGDITIPVLTDGDKGDITLTSSGTVWTIDNDVVTFAKIQNITGDRILGRISGTSGDVGEITGAQVNTILPDATTSLGGRMSATDKTKLNGLTAFIGCSLTNSSNQTLAQNSFTAPAWNTEEYDIGGFHTGSENGITIPTTGYYMFTFNVATNNTGNYGLYIYSSSGKQINSVQVVTNLYSSLNDGVSISGVFKCTTGDTINSGVYLTGTGADRDLLATYSYFNASLIGI